MSSLSHVLMYFNLQDLKTGGEFTGNLMDVRWLLHVLGQRGPITLSGFEYLTEEPVPSWSAWTVNSLRFGDFSFKSSSCVSHETSCVWNSHPQVQFCFYQMSSCVPANHTQCRLHSAHWQISTLCTSGVTQSFCSVTALSIGWDIPHDKTDRLHFCLPHMETSPATFLSPGVVIRKWLSHFGLRRSSLEAFSCGDVALQALPGLLVMWAYGVHTSVERYQYSTGQLLLCYKNYILPISETVSVFHSLNSIHKMHYCLRELIGVTPSKLYSLNLHFNPKFFLGFWIWSNCLADMDIGEG